MRTLSHILAFCERGEAMMRAARATPSVLVMDLEMMAMVEEAEESAESEDESHEDITVVIGYVGVEAMQR